MKLTIRTKLLVGALIILCMFGALQYLFYDVTKQHSELHVGVIQLDKAETAALQIENFFSDIEAENRVLAHDYSEDPSDLNEVAHLASHTFLSNKFIEKITFLTPGGKEILKVDKAGVTPEADLSYEIESKSLKSAIKGTTAPSQLYYAGPQQSPYFDLFFPIFSNKASVVGVIKTQISLENLWDIISKVGDNEDGIAYVVNDQGLLIAHPNHAFLKERPNLSSRNVISQLLQNPSLSQTQGDFHYQNEKHVDVLAKAVKVPELNWIVVFEQPTSEALSVVTAITNLLLFSYTGLFIFVFILLIVFSVNITNPIKELQKATKLLQSGELSTRTAIRSGDEIEDLGNAFNQMASGLQDSFHALELSQISVSSERNKLAVILASISDALLAIDLEQRVILFNKAAEKLTGYTEKEVLQKKIDEVITLYDTSSQVIPVAQYSPIAASQQAGKIYANPSVKLVSGGRSEKQVSITTGQIVESHQANVGAIITLHDITQEHELEKMKLDFVSMAAHELRTPLTSIQGYLDVLYKEIKESLNTNQQLFFERIKASSERLQFLIENLLNVSRIERGQLTSSLQPINLEPIIDQVVSDLANRAREKQLSLLFTAPQSPLPSVIADQSRIQEVLANLISNAIQYTDTGSVTISLEQQGNEVITHIQDTGIGIPEESLPHLFTKFFRVKDSLVQGRKGTGLGLYITKSIIEQHHGRIWVKSVAGKGSVFSFALPIAQSSEHNPISQ